MEYYKSVPEPDFRLLFEKAPHKYIVMAPDSPKFTVIAVSDGYLRATLTVRENIVGRGMFEVFPDNPDKPEDKSTESLRRSLERVLAHKRSDTMAVQKYDIPTALQSSKAFEERYWMPVNNPVFTPDTRDICAIIHQAEDVTAYVQATTSKEKGDVELEKLQTEKTFMEREIVMRTEEIKHANEALQQANTHLSSALIKAEAANRSKAEFLANTSHEIRTPLNAVIGFAQLLGKDPTISPAHRTQVQSIHSAGEHLLELINLVLDMSRLEAGKTMLMPRPLRLRELIDDTAKLMSIKCEEKGIYLKVQLADSLPSVILADPLRLRQMLMNLLSNAYKHTEKGGITLSAAATNVTPTASTVARHALLFEVKDTGCGIDPIDLPRLFMQFSQGSKRTALGGTGLGLAITRKLARLMDGDASVESTVGVGSTFRIEVFAQELPPEMNMNSDNQLVHKCTVEDKELPILIVDDVVTNRQVMRAMLTELGFRNIVEAPDGVAALHQITLKDKFPAVVFMDLFMPVMDGFEATRRVRQLPAGLHLPVVAVSASFLDPGELKNDVDLFQGFLSKPYGIDELRTALEAHVGLRFEASAIPVPVAAVPELIVSDLPEDVRAPPGKKRILVVDDNHLNQTVLNTMLSRAGHLVESRSSGQGAIELVGSGTSEFDVILMDRHMPGMSGLEATKKIRELLSAKNKHVKIYCVTADLITPADLDLIRKSGMDGGISKPIKMETLLKLLN